MASEIEFDMQPVVSTQLASAGYDEATRQLQIEFSNGSIYVYSEVPKETYESLMAAPSVGAFFNQNVKWGFSYRRLV